MILWDKTEDKFKVNESTARKADRVVVQCDNCSKQLDRILQQHENSIKSKGIYLCHDCATKSKEFKNRCSENAKLKWQDPEYIKNNLDAVSSEEYRELQSKITKNRWSDPKFMELMNSKASEIGSKRARKAWNNEGYKEKQSDIISSRMKSKWQDPEYRSNKTAAQSDISKRMWEDKRDKLLETFRSELFKSKMKAIGENQSEDSRQKLSKASKALWGNEKYRSNIINIMQSNEMRLKLSKANKGIRRLNANSSSDFINRATSVHGGIYDYSNGVYDGSKEPFAIRCEKHGIFYQSPNNHLRGTRCPKCAATFSLIHQDIAKFIEGCSVSFTLNDRSIIKPYEIDIFIPSRPLAIEVDGLYWHSYGINDIEDRNRHASKADLCNGIDIPLLMIRENEWIERNNIVKSMITNRLGLSNRIFGRKCDVVKISDEYAKFMNDNHLQGSRPAKHKFGLVHNGELVMAIGFSKHYKYEYEIIRMASKNNYTVVGGVSKLISHFIKEVKPRSIMTYADRRYSVGAGYFTAGFNLDGITSPGYCYIKDGKVYPRQRFQKHLLENRLEFFNSDLSESRNMFINGYRRLWDAGHFRLLMKV